MTTASLIGKETAIARLMVWHKQRIARAFPLMSDEGHQIKLIEATSGMYVAVKSAKIYKEYDEVFSDTDGKWTADDQSTMSERLAYA
jgi:hypothetical protein